MPRRGLASGDRRFNLELDARQRTGQRPVYSTVGVLLRDAAAGMQGQQGSRARRTHTARRPACIARLPSIGDPMLLSRVVRTGALATATAAAAAAATAASNAAAPASKTPISLAGQSVSGEVVENWSGTHSASPLSYFSPMNSAAVQNILEAMHAAGERLRVVGSALSPNGIGLSDEAMLNMGQMDAILSIDKEKMQVKVQAGARVSTVVEELRKHGLTLQNYASIAEQQIGGFVQVGAHGTGAAIPPVDEQVVSFQMHTPGMGILKLDPERCPGLFYLARVGLGWLGVVSEVTIQCVPAHKLIQHTFVETRAGIQKRHEELLKHQHARYMWIPHTDCVVVVTCDPFKDGDEVPSISKPSYNIDWQDGGLDVPKVVPERAMRQLLIKKAEAAGKPVDADAINGMSFAQLRDALIALAPLDKAHVIEINKAEAKFWKASEAYRVDWSDKILGFECGGQQWVSEVAFPCGQVGASDGKDLAYMQELLATAEATDLAIPAPIEQRWTSRSRSTMSPAYSEGENDLFSWVGIIMYLPTDEKEQRAAITERFWEYNKLCRDKLWAKYACHQHWAKIELPDADKDLEWVRERLWARFPLAKVWETKQKVDPKGVLGNTLIDTLLLPDGALVESHHRLLASFDAAKKASAAEKKQGWFKARGWF